MPAKKRKTLYNITELALIYDRIEHGGVSRYDSTNITDRTNARTNFMAKKTLSKEIMDKALNEYFLLVVKDVMAFENLK